MRLHDFARELHALSDRLYALAKEADRVYGIAPGRFGSDMGDALREAASAVLAIEVRVSA